MVSKILLCILLYYASMRHFTINYKKNIQFVDWFCHFPSLPLPPAGPYPLRSLHPVKSCPSLFPSLINGRAYLKQLEFLSTCSEIKKGANCHGNAP